MPADKPTGTTDRVRHRDRRGLVRHAKAVGIPTLDDHDLAAIIDHRTPRARGSPQAPVRALVQIPPPLRTQADHPGVATRRTAPSRVPSARARITQERLVKLDAQNPRSGRADNPHLDAICGQASTPAPRAHGIPPLPARTCPTPGTPLRAHTDDPGAETSSDPADISATDAPGSAQRR